MLGLRLVRFFEEHQEFFGAFRRQLARLQHRNDVFLFLDPTLAASHMALRHFEIGFFFDGLRLCAAPGSAAIHHVLRGWTGTDTVKTLPRPTVDATSTRCPSA